MFNPEIGKLQAKYFHDHEISIIVFVTYDSGSNTRWLVGVIIAALAITIDFVLSSN